MSDPQRVQLSGRVIKWLCVAAILPWLVACAATTPPERNGQLVSSIEEFDQAVASLQPGDRIILANGTWTDVEFRLVGQGTAEQPIRLEAEEPGEVIISGQSNLSFSGTHLHISGLVFKEGYTPTSEVISFRTSPEDVASHSRVTNTVIDNFSNPERQDSDTWVAVYGKNNRFDHNSLLNKRNKGVTLAVRMNTEASRENDHRIDHNYFGPRQTLGSNGGETLRIGTSHYSREYSNTVVENNYFDRTSGELEIISSKSCGNVFRGNVFFESQGTLTMRHGHYTLVENNYFLGNRLPNTGGIRIINKYQTVRNNYLYGLTGHRFRGALVIMNGVPNSPANRYDQVVDSLMNNNVVVDSDHIQLCAGADAERSAAPIGSSMHNNIIMNQTNLKPFTVYDDISGISFEGNILNEEAEAPLEDGFEKAPYQVETNVNGLRTPSSDLLRQIEFGEVRLPVGKDDTGAAFYPKPQRLTAFGSGSVVPVEPGRDTLVRALERSKPGDTLLLVGGGEYAMMRYASIQHPITIRSEGPEKAKVFSEKASFFIIENGGSLQLENLWMDGAESPDQPGNNVISTSRYSMNENYTISVKNCRVTNLDVNHSFDFLKTYRNTFADRVEVLDTEMSNVTGSILSFDMETDDLGIYNVENLRIEGSRFTDIQGAVANVYRGGTDESTFGPIVTIEDNEFSRVGSGTRNRTGASLRFHGVQHLVIDGSQWTDSAPIDLHLTNGEPINEISDLTLIGTDPIRTNSENLPLRNVTVQ